MGFNRGIEPVDAMGTGLATSPYYSRIVELLYKITGYEGEINLTSHLFNDICMDSLDAVEMLIEVEKEFNIEISDESVDHVETVKDIIVYLENLK